MRYVPCSSLWAAIGNTFLTAALIAAALSGAPTLADAGDSAWTVLEQTHPAALADISSLERKILQVLTPDQAVAYSNGVDPGSITLANGETLDEFVDRIEKRRSAGLVYTPLEQPCLLLDTRRSGEALEPEDSRSFRARGEMTDYSAQGGSSKGCGLPGLAGDTFKINVVRSLLLDVEVVEADAEGDLRIWPGRAYQVPEVGLVRFGRTDGNATFKSSVIVMTCDEESRTPCDTGDFEVQARGSRVHVLMHVLGYFKDTVGTSADKSDGLWETDDPDGIYYDAGNVGIGVTPGPVAALKVAGPDNDGTNAPLRVISGEQKMLIDGNEIDSKNDRLYLNHNSGHDIVMVEHGGSVGIRTQTPESALHIRGDGTADDLSGGTLRVTSGGGAQNLVLDGDEIDTVNQRLHINSNSGKDVVLVENGGRVGIGTGTPHIKFHVQGEDTAGNLTGGVLKLTSGSQSMKFDGNEIDSMDTDLYLNHNSNRDVIMVDNGGRVGIGTDDPQAELHVATHNADNKNATINITARGVISDENDDVDVRIWAIKDGSGGIPDGGYFGTWSNHSLKFKVNDVELMKLGHDGEIYLDNGEARVEIGSDGTICIGKCD